ncbi:hypothetical protein BJF93_00100 [Xaviernesmea oryzae]|uniref:DUF924 domain-containing protein n=1 Tax=Xaviernesmea oryzae TaxID=464029 RepID=A0A1Q9B089_9HYPH|nr:DUF924 family protein [Xaviernesmea oryzae]OLP61389.1 hypothetical protein BJF93_00100 [Xaviernesmea oryzae]SEL71091.1 Uncharacterized conserved protein, DUF924 family [Xaviernesmea oryzae]
MTSAIDPGAILDFWFSDHARAHWFQSTPAFDQEVEERFLGDYQRVRAGEADALAETADGCLVLILFCDQFPRNMFRGTARAFESDAKALELAEGALERGYPEGADADRQMFFYLPFMHSEDAAHQSRCVALFSNRPEHENSLDFARQHAAIINRFGRFPHRNAALGRDTSQEEAAFLQDHAGF